MHVLVTDSGVGGLSVCAYAERFVRTRGFAEPVRLTFANAAPANDYGYNAMPSRDDKLATFDRFLANAVARYAPDLVYVACNTLSVLLPDTPFARTSPIPIKGIIDSGVTSLMRELDARPHSVAMILGTQTTIDAGVYPRVLEARGVEAARIVAQACPGLADTISEDREGTRTRAAIATWVGAALAQMPRADVVACLACTHYGYRTEMFADVLAEAGVAATVVNPNDSAVDDIFGAAGGEHRDADVEVVSRYVIPPTALDALTGFLASISPRTVAALRDHVHSPELF
jgi:glutamate racemase